MYLIYVDESGDPGISKYGSKHYILSGLIIYSNNWNKLLSRMTVLRKKIKNDYGLLLRTEIHASELIRINKTEEYRQIKKSKRIQLLKEFAIEIPRIFSNEKIINICLKKEEFSDIEEFQTLAWSRLIQRYDTFLKKNGNKKGIIVADDTDEPLIRKLIRKMRVYNPISSHFNSTYYNSPTDNIIEDAFMRRSEHSYLIQVADVVSHLLYRKEYPKGSLKKYGVEKYFDLFEPILLKEACKYDDFGIVRK